MHLAFAITLWVYFALCLTRSEDVYGFKNEDNYFYMTLALGVTAFSVTISLIYVTFYSLSQRVCKSLEMLDYMFKIIALYTLTVVYLIA
jgi:hypothetical protein